MNEPRTYVATSSVFPGMKSKIEAANASEAKTAAWLSISEAVGSQQLVSGVSVWNTIRVRLATEEELGSCHTCGGQIPACECEWRANAKRLDCHCADDRKPCHYHEGYDDGHHAAREELGR